jgi:hypothetical protein
VQSSLFFAASIGDSVKPCRRVEGIARRAIPTWTVAGIAHWGVPTLAGIFRVVFMYWTCLGIMCTFEHAVCNIMWILYKFDRLWYINVVCDILLLICGLWYIYALLFTWKIKKKRFPEWLPRVHVLWHSGKRVSSPSAWAPALGEEGVFPECLGYCAQGRGCLPRVSGLRRSGKRVSSPSVALGEDFFLKKKKREGNGAGCSPKTSPVPRVSGRLSGKPSPSARFWALW